MVSVGIFDADDVFAEEVWSAVETIATRSADALQNHGAAPGVNKPVWSPSFVPRFSTRVAARSLALSLSRSPGATRAGDRDNKTASGDVQSAAVELSRELRRFDALTLAPEELQRQLDDGWCALKTQLSREEAFAAAWMDCMGRLARAVERRGERVEAQAPGDPAEAHALWAARLLGATYGALLSFTASREPTASTRRDLGAFFTPRPLVGTALSLLPRWRLEGAGEGEGGGAAGLRIPTEERGARVCDPACGAGAFLLEIALEMTRGRRGEVPGRGWDWTAEFSRVVHEQIYGVDIDEHAIDVCAMSLWLAARAPRLEHVEPWAGLRIGNALLGLHGEGPVAGDRQDLESHKRAADEATVTLLESCRGKIKARESDAALARPLAVYGLRAPIHWHLEFPEVFPRRSEGQRRDVQRTSGFDYVVGNPPFVDSERMTREYPEVRAAVARRFTTARGNWDLFVPFVELAFSLLREGGCVSYVLPRVALAADYAAKAQALLFEHTPLEIRTVKGISVFEAARVQICIIAARKGAPVATHAVRCVRDDAVGTGAYTELASIAMASLKRLPKGFIALPLEPGSEASLGLLDLPLRVSDLAEVGDGATTKEAYELRDLLFESPLGGTAAGRVRLVNTGTIDPFELLWSHKVTRYLGRRLLRPMIACEDLEKVAPRRARQAARRGVVLAGLARRLEAAVVEAGILCGKSTVQLLTEPGCCPYALAAWLNSTPVQRLYRGLFAYRGFGEGAMNIGPRQVRQLPVPERRWLVDGVGRTDGEIGGDTRLSEAGRRLSELLVGEDDATEELAGLDRLVDEIVGKCKR